MAHLLPRLGLARAYIACFFGDNYPIPRPNRLYQRIAEEGVHLQFWSLLSYVAALRAGALGDDWAFARSLEGTDVARALGESGQYAELSLPGGARAGAVRALRPDVAFLHVPLADPVGNVAVGQPSCEGFWAASGARLGAIVTAERIVSERELAAHRECAPLHPDRVLAVCHEPRGAHPQPLVTGDHLGEGAPDDFEHYRLWRRLATDDAALAEFERMVLDAADGAEGYRAWCEAMGASRLGAEEGPGEEFARSGEITLVLGARAICRRARAGRYRTIIAGIGQAYFASRLAALWLEADGHPVEVVLETGLMGLSCGAAGHPFPLSHHAMRSSRRLGDAERALGLWACGADNRCLGVIGSGQVDETGAVNSTRAGARVLVGPGGATDIAALCAEVVVLGRCTPDRLVRRVDHVTSSGRNVRCVVTDACTFERGAAGDAWRIEELYPAWGGLPLKRALERVREACPWGFDVAQVHTYAQAISTREMVSVHGLRASDQTWTRELAPAGGGS